MERLSGDQLLFQTAEREDFGRSNVDEHRLWVEPRIRYRFNREFWCELKYIASRTQDRETGTTRNANRAILQFSYQHNLLD